MNEPSRSEFHYGSTLVSNVPTNDESMESDGSTELTGSGLAAEKARRLDRVAEIPMAGMPHSLNAATSASIAVYEYCRQWPAGGGAA